MVRPHGRRSDSNLWSHLLLLIIIFGVGEPKTRPCSSNVLPHGMRKGPSRFRPLPKEDGCRFYNYKFFGTKATVRKVITMMNLSHLLPSKAWSVIIHSAVSWKQNCENNRIEYSVMYPGGYGVSIVKDYCEGNDQDDLWTCYCLQGNKRYCGDNGEPVKRTHCTDYEVVAICEHVRAIYMPE